MKRFTFFLVFFLFTVMLNAAPGDVIIEPVPPGPRPRVTSINPVSVSVINNELVINFNRSVGDATITIKDEVNNVVYEEIEDTNNISVVYIPTDMLESGYYTLYVTYGYTTMRIFFSIE